MKMGMNKDVLFKNRRLLKFLLQPPYFFLHVLTYVEHARCMYMRAFVECSVVLYQHNW
jgi:hypothetical protein